MSTSQTNPERYLFLRPGIRKDAKQNEEIAGKALEEAAKEVTW